MKIDISISIERGSSASGWKEKGMALVREANEAANASGISAEERNLRQHWLGGAIRLYATAAGESAEEIRASLPKPSSATNPPTADPTTLPMGAIGVVTPPEKRTNRPPRHPGAGRPVSDPPDLPVEMFDGLPEFRAVGEAVQESELESPPEDPPTVVTAHAPEIRTAEG